MAALLTRMSSRPNSSRAASTTGLRLLGVPGVSHPPRHLADGALEGRRGTLELVGLARREHHVGSGLGEAARDGEPDALARPRDHGRLAVEPDVHAPAPPGAERSGRAPGGSSTSPRSAQRPMRAASRHRRMNRLAGETSPYLRQHADNPVDWYPWGTEALELARRADKPLFVSIGYSSCHWCHVMAHECFEDPAVAKELNRSLRLRQGGPRGTPRRRLRLHGGRAGHDGAGGLADVRVPHAGRPTILLRAPTSPRRRPRHAGLPTRRRGHGRGLGPLDGPTSRPTGGRGQQGRRPRTLRLVDRLSPAPAPDSGGGEGGGPGLLDRVVDDLADRFDDQWGGFGPAPEVPTARRSWTCALRHHLTTGGDRSLRPGDTTLDAMAAGGIYDHVAGGFARYSTDATWTRAALREDALPTRSCWSGPTCMPGSSPASDD